MVIRCQTANRARRAPGHGPPRPERMQVKRNLANLLTWVWRYEGLERRPSINDALAGKHMLYFAEWRT